MKGEYKAIISMLIWGSVGIFARFSELDGLSLAFYRVLFSSVFFLVFYLIKDRERLLYSFNEAIDKIKHISLIGIALGFNWVFFFYAVMLTQIAKALLVYYLAPLFVIIFSTIYLKERPRARTIFLAVMAFLGFLTIICEDIGDFNQNDMLGVFFAFLASLLYATVTILGRYLRSFQPLSLTFFQLAFATLSLSPFMILYGQFVISLQSIAVVMVIALVHTILALLIYMDALREVEASRVALLSYLDPLSAIVYALVIFGEIPSFHTMIGGFLILASSICNIYYKSRKV
ncbi:MAG: EamA family transporter [Thermoproteales archaeon]|nr:EamA family transporter [Thermoproteales archaeon]